MVDRFIAAVCLMFPLAAWAEVSDKMPSIAVGWVITVLLVVSLLVAFRFDFRLFVMQALFAVGYQSYVVWDVFFGPLAEQIRSEMGWGYSISHLVGLCLVLGAVVFFALKRFGSKH